MKLLNFFFIEIIEIELLGSRQDNRINHFDILNAFFLERQPKKIEPQDVVNIGIFCYLKEYATDGRDTSFKIRISVPILVKT